MGTILIVILVLLLIGALPTWSHSKSWGPYPSGGIGLIFCEKKEGPVERAGKQIDKAVEKAGQQIEKAGEKIQDAAKDTDKK